MHRARPTPVVLNIDSLHNIRNAIRDGTANRPTVACLAELCQRADILLHRGPWTVTSKTVVSPSGDIHDYVSQAPYWWPSDTPDGLPYVRRDGFRCPETLIYTDKADRAAVFDASFTLALAWFYTSKEAYARHAATVIRTWFISPSTRMNPNLNHAQFIKGVNQGRAIGVIDFSMGYTSVLDAAAILASENAPGWSDADVNCFHDWNVEFLDWLLHSEFGISESKELNNHGTLAIMQKAAIALFIGDKSTLMDEIEAMKRRIDFSILADGSQPLELERTRSWHYSCFNLMAFIRMAEICKKVDVDLWNYGSQGPTLHTAVNFLIPAAIGAAEWTFPEVEVETFAASDIIRSAAIAGNDKAKNACNALALPVEDFWPLRPAPEQLDPVR